MILLNSAFDIFDFILEEPFFQTLIYWVVRKVRANFEGKLKRRRFKF